MCAVNKCLMQATDMFGSMRLWGELSIQDTLGVVSCLSGFIEQREYGALKVKTIDYFNHSYKDS